MVLLKMWNCDSIVHPKTIDRITVTASNAAIGQTKQDSSTTTRIAGDLDFTAIAGKRQGCEAPGLKNPIKPARQRFNSEEKGFADRWADPCKILQQ
jgi:hypothetical protein